MCLADVVYAAGSAGLALRLVRSDVITATGSRPDVRSYTPFRDGGRPRWGDIDGQDISMVGGSGRVS